MRKQDTPGETNQHEILQRTTTTWHKTENNKSPHKTRGTQERNHDNNSVVMQLKPINSLFISVQ